MRFFKPSVFIKSFLVSCVVFLSAFFSSCKDLAGFDPNVNGERTVASGTFSAPQNLTATNGYRRKITLEWTAVSGASKYEIWCASSNTSSDDEWKIVQVTDKIQYDDKVSAGRTLYYRVRAVKATGVTSRYSTIVKGTSLAVPVISGGEVKDSSVTIQWFMENARGVDGKSNYEDELRFDVYCQKKDGGEPITKTFTASELNSEYKHTFENLAGTTNYQFWIEAYTTKDQSVEKSPVVDVNTLTSYTPLAPEFNATKGESAKGVWLYIYLPEMVMVNTETNDSLNEKVDEPYPLYFKIYRKADEDADGNYEEVCKNLYYNGSTTPPETSYYTSNPYKAGERIEWFDDSADLKGGQKYTYKVRAFVDANYSKVVCPVGKEYQDQGVGTSETQAKTDTGWKSATPDFNVKEVKGSKVSSEDTVLAIEFAFSASWQDLGEAGKYKFAIKQHREPWDASSPGSDGDKDKWLEKRTGEYFFDTLDEVRSRTVKFGSPGEGLDPKEEGIYTYTLYIVRQKNSNNDVTISDVESDGENVVLDSVDAKDKALVTHEVNIPKPELTVKDGYTDHVHLIISGLKKEDKDATYTLIRTLIVDGRPEGVEEIPLEIPESAFSSGSYECDDDDNGKKLPGNQRYSYVLKATAESGAYSQTDSQDAETLGTPEVAFEMGKLAYDSITISFNGVLAANKYVVKLGASEGFGNGEEFTITKDASASGNDDSNDKEGAESQDEKWSCDTDSAKVSSFVANRFTVTIEKPFGYDDATLAGKSADLTVTAHSMDSAPSEAVSVNVVGPAPLATRANTSAEAQDDSISLSWNKVEGANGYLIKRVMYDSVEMKEVADASDVTYYCDGSTVTLVDGSNLGGRATVSDADGKLTLTDNYMEMDENFDLDQEYQDAQSKIPWGLPFRYVVLPVLDKGDFEFVEKSLALADGGKVKYEKIEETQTEGTATCGYGLNPVAEKAMSGNTQGLKWEKPYNADLRPVVYRREAGSGGSFDLFYENNSLNGKDSANLTIEAKDNFYGAFEYIVKYCSKDPSLNFDVPPSLLKEIAKNKQSYETPNDNKEEQDNKGYLLTLENFDAKVHPNTDYYEQISWKNWDYNTRAVGPDYMVIKVQNNNIDATYHKIVKITNANANNGTEALDVDTTDITAKAEAQATIAVAPKSIVEGAGTTNGMLKVLRDYKHNYTIELHRAIDEESELTVKYEEYEKDNYVKTAYRQITDEELVRAATLVMSIGFEKAWAKNSSDPWSRTKSDRNYTADSPGSGSIKYSTSTGVSWNYNPGTTLTYSSLCVALTTRSGDNVPSFVSVAGTINGDANSYTAISPPARYYGTVTIDSTVPNYNASLVFDLQKSSGSITVQRNGHQSEFGNITPLPFHSSTPVYKFEGYNDTEEWQ